MLRASKKTINARKTTNKALAMKTLVSFVRWRAAPDWVVIQSASWDKARIAAASPWEVSATNSARLRWQIIVRSINFFICLRPISALRQLPELVAPRPVYDSSKSGTRRQECH
jgi:hypothetical protein